MVVIYKNNNIKLCHFARFVFVANDTFERKQNVQWDGDYFWS